MDWSKSLRLLLALFCVIATVPVSADELSLQRLRSYLRLDTTNPPGNELIGARFFAEILDREGIAYRIAESAPGRGNIWARLEGGNEPALVLLHHMDVVPATASSWNSDPLGATLQDGYVTGRGALDTKALGIAHLEAFLQLHRKGRALRRDVVFMATADEEAGGKYGAGWIASAHPEAFAGAGFLLNEGGMGAVEQGRETLSIEVAQKRPYWLRLIANDVPGHGSMPLESSATGRLVAALERIRSTPFEVHVVPEVRRMFSAMAAGAGDTWSAQFADIDAAVRDQGFLRRLQAQRPHLHALLRNTCSITMLQGSNKINVIPPSATAELDCRILPDQDSAAFQDSLRERIADEGIRIEELLVFDAASSPTDTGFYRLMDATLRRHFPQALVVPSVAAGFTDSHYFRDQGIASYGFAPWLIDIADLRGVHGNNERISVQGFTAGLRIMKDLVEDFVMAP